jgi:hypothetical protein
MLVGASRHEGRSPSSHVSDLATKRDLHVRIGGLEASMQLIMDQLQIMTATSSLAENRQIKTPSAYNSTTKTTEEDNYMELTVKNFPQVHT